MSMKITHISSMMVRSTAAGLGMRRWFAADVDGDSFDRDHPARVRKPDAASVMQAMELRMWLRPPRPESRLIGM
jgi:hypothetical protein